MFEQRQRVGAEAGAPHQAHSYGKYLRFVMRLDYNKSGGRGREGGREGGREEEGGRTGGEGGRESKSGETEFCEDSQ